MIFNLIVVINIVVVVLFLVLAMAFWSKYFKKLKTCNLTVGEIVNIEVKENDYAANQDGLYTVSMVPRIKYHVDSKDYLFDVKTFGSSWKEGKRVKVIFDKKNPSEANLLLSYILPASILTVLFVVFSFVLVLFLCLFYNGLIYF